MTETVSEIGPQVVNPMDLWDDHAGDRIASVIQQTLASSFRRPTDV